MSKGQKVKRSKRSKFEKVKRSKGQNVKGQKGQKGQKVKTSKGQKVKRLKPLKYIFFHFPTVYTNQEINEYLRYRKVYYIVEKVFKMLFNENIFGNDN